MITVDRRSIATFVAGLVAAVVVVVTLQAWRVDASPGESDATFMPITPCRLIDTRSGDLRIGPLDTFGPGETETVAARGSNGECSIPPEAIGLSLNVTATDATALTFLTVWPDGERPEASSLNPAPGQPPTPNAVTTQLSTSGSFEVFNLTGTVDVIVDVNGVYLSSSLIELEERLAKTEAAETIFNFNEPDIQSSSNVLLTNSIVGDVPYAGTVAATATVSLQAPSGVDVVCNLRGASAESTVPIGSEPTLVTGLGSRWLNVTTTWWYRVDPTDSFEVGFYCGPIGVGQQVTYRGARLTVAYDPTT